jgi:hypothetical protein
MFEFACTQVSIALCQWLYDCVSYSFAGLVDFRSEQALEVEQAAVTAAENSKPSDDAPISGNKSHLLISLRVF